MSTFELFLQLPLFKCIDRDDLFSLIPKISLDFENHQPGEAVFNREMEVKGLIFLLHGKVKVCEAARESMVSGPCLLSFTGMFGENRNYRSDVYALDACSTLSIDEKSLQYLLRNNSIFLTAYLGMLSDTIHKLYSTHLP
jgi:hypothetical protein